MNDIDLIQFMVDDIKIERELFESIIVNDFTEVKAIQEGLEIETIQESTNNKIISSIVAKLDNAKKFLSSFKVGKENNPNIDMSKINEILKTDLSNFKYKYREMSKSDLVWIRPDYLVIVEPYSSMSIEQIESDIKYTQSSQFSENILGELLGDNNGINESEFYDKCKNYVFKKQVENTGITKSDINKIIDNINKYSKRIKETDKMKERVIKWYNDAIKDLEDKKPKNESDRDHFNKYIMLCKYKYENYSRIAIKIIETRYKLIEYDYEQNMKIYNQLLSYSGLKEYCDTIMQEALNDVIDYELSMNKY